MTAIKKKTKKKIATKKKNKSAAPVSAARTGSERGRPAAKKGITPTLVKKGSVESAATKPAAPIASFDSVCPIEVGFVSKLRRGNSGVFNVGFDLHEATLERAGFDVDYASFSCVYDFEKGLLLEVSSPPALYRAGGAAFYTSGRRTISSAKTGKLYWSWDGGSLEDDVSGWGKDQRDRSWGYGVDSYLSDTQFEEWARAVMARLREASFSKAKR